jgi:hypothetical protein
MLWMMDGSPPKVQVTLATPRLLLKSVKLVIVSKVIQGSLFVTFTISCELNRLVLDPSAFPLFSC